MFFPGLLSIFLFFSLLIYVALPLSMANLTAYGLVLPLNLFLVFVNLSLFSSDFMLHSGSFYNLEEEVQSWEFIPVWFMIWLWLCYPSLFWLCSHSHVVFFFRLLFSCFPLRLPTMFRKSPIFLPSFFSWCPVLLYSNCILSLTMWPFLQ